VKVFSQLLYQFQRRQVFIMGVSVPRKVSLVLSELVANVTGERIERE
jgi:hypothetical protein